MHARSGFSIFFNLDLFLEWREQNNGSLVLHKDHRYFALDARFEFGHEALQIRHGVNAVVIERMALGGELSAFVPIAEGHWADLQERRRLFDCHKSFGHVDFILFA